MNKKLLIILFALIAFVFGACSFNVDIDMEKGSGNVISEDRQVSGFDRVELSGFGDVTLVQGDQEALRIEAEDNLIPYIQTEVQNGVLRISFGRKTILPTKPVKFYLTMRDVHGLSTQGMSNITASQIQADQLDVEISGTGNVNIDDLKTDRLVVNVSGAGNFEAAGQANSQQVRLSGAGNFDCADLQSSSSEVTITGLGRVNTWVTDQLTVTISGTGNVDYYGDPQVSQHISGLGHLNNQGNK